ncbi:SPOR domain-containing protein [Ostreiculturibacter nitratireducens]|uniref:SPOR domain-containing protein n=1 Tax=Ostreiculturibacter nitratireducens TaxID=3075226 RepID=UPI0031B5E866
MADNTFRDYSEFRGPETAGQLNVSRIVNIAGAATSFALVAGLAVWGYKLAVRDVAGVPVIRALEGPARIAPEDPGGELARHTGLAVNAVAAEGTAEAPADRLVLAPRPDDLGEEALPMAELRPVARAAAPVEPTAEAADAALAEPETTQPASLAETLEPGADPAERAIALAEEMANAAEPLAVAPAEAEAVEGAPEVAAQLEIIAADVPGVSRSPRPMTRPATAPRRVAPEAVGAAIALALAPEAEAGVRAVDPESLPLGTILVQLGAYDDPETAKREWERISVRFGALMEGKGRVIQETETGGRRFFRLRVEGFPEMADARRFCAALLAEDAACIATQVR